MRRQKNMLTTASSMASVTEVMELLVLAHYSLKKGNSSDARNLLTLAFKSNGMDRFIQSLDNINQQVESFVATASGKKTQSSINSEPMDTVMDKLMIELSSNPDKFFASDDEPLYGDPEEDNDDDVIETDNELVEDDGLPDEEVEPSPETLETSSPRRIVVSKEEQEELDQIHDQESGVSKRRRLHKANVARYKRGA